MQLTVFLITVVLTDINKISVGDVMEYLGYIIHTRDKTLDDAAGGDIKRAKALLNSLHNKITWG
jgi:tartrate dehydratase beta subunit/fumarate hydratase class I family protein